MNRTVLLISYYFPPLGMGGVQRTAKLAKYLPRFGYDVIVLTVKPIRYGAHDPTLLDELPASVRIYRSGSSDPARIGKFLPLPRRADIKLKSSARDTLSRFWPDSKIGWKKPALRMAEKIMANHPVDIILSSSPPITAHLVAMEIKRKHGLPWVADFRDLWESRLPENVFAKDDQIQEAYHLLSEISGSADAVTRVNDSIGVEIFDSAQTILGGYDPEDFEFLNSDITGDKFSLCYLGTVGPIAPIHPFFHAAKILADRESAFGGEIRFTVVGANDISDVKRIADRFGWNNRVTISGYMPHREALQKAAMSSAYLLSVPSGYPFITTGKLFDYLALPGPILAAVPSGGEAEKLIVAYHAGLCAEPDDVSTLADHMLTLFRDRRSGQVWNKGDISTLTRIEAARKFGSIFDRIIDEYRK